VRPILHQDNLYEMVSNAWVRYEGLALRDWESLSEPERLVVAFGEPREEVNNGGFDQYFFNSAGDHAEHALLAAKRAGLDVLADLVKRAIEALGGDSYPSDRFARQERVLELPDGAIEVLDDEYYALESTAVLDSVMESLADT
jgi:Domain of unknown function (DUF4375)